MGQVNLESIAFVSSDEAFLQGLLPDCPELGGQGWRVPVPFNCVIGEAFVGRSHGLGLQVDSVGSG